MDRDLVEAARHGDQEAFVDLVRLHGDRLFAIAHRILRDVDRAEDALQDANGLVQTGCIDDDRIGQAQGLLTLDTMLGTTYLVQIGGVIGQFAGDPEDPQWGRLRLQIN